MIDPEMVEQRRKCAVCGRLTVMDVPADCRRQRAAGHCKTCGKWTPHDPAGTTRFW